MEWKNRLMVINNYLQPGIIYRLSILSDGSTIIRTDHDGKSRIYREIEQSSQIIGMEKTGENKE